VVSGKARVNIRNMRSTVSARRASSQASSPSTFEYYSFRFVSPTTCEGDYGRRERRGSISPEPGPDPPGSRSGARLPATRLAYVHAYVIESLFYTCTLNYFIPVRSLPAASLV
jgi:hypothetical protein